MTTVLALLVVAALVVGAGVLGFDVIMRPQTVITVVTGVLTVVYVVLVAGTVDWTAVSALPAGSASAMVGALVLVLTGFGLGWVNVAADYTRYLPRSASERGIVGWTTFGASIAPIVLLVVGLLLAGSSPQLSEAIAADPIGALTATLPTWFLVPFALAAVLGLVGGAVLDIYSSGLALLSLGLPAPRWVAALIDGVLMVIGTVYVVFFAGEFLPQFTGFLITLGVPVAAWCGILLADIAMRRTYADAELYDTGGRYGVGAVARRRAARRGDCAGLGSGHELAGRVADVAGLPARSRPRRPRGPVGVREPGGAAGAGAGLRRLARDQGVHRPFAAGGDVRFLVLIWSNPESRGLWEQFAGEQQLAGLDAYRELDAELAASGEFVAAHPLADASRVRRVHVRDGAVSTTDGPYAEVKEHLAGFYLVECASQERAIEIAARIPEAAFGLVDVRPTVDLESLGP